MKNQLIILSLLVFVFSCNTIKKTNKMDEKNVKNPTENVLLKGWNTPFGTPPFDKIKSEDYLPALKLAMAEQNSEIHAIASRKDKPTFNNTILALELSGSLLKKISRVFDAVEAANTDDILKSTSKIIQP